MCLMESCFPDSWKVSSVVSVIKIIGDRSTTKNYCLVSLLSVYNKFFEKLQIYSFQQGVAPALLDKLKCCKILHQVFDHFLHFLSNRWLYMVLNGKSLQELEFLVIPFLALHFFLQYINDLLDVICNLDLFTDDTTFYCRCDQASCL